MSQKLNSSPFCVRNKFPKKDFTEKEYIHYMNVEEVSKDFNPEKPHEFLIEVHTEEYERIPIDEYINQFSNKVGLKNELKGVISKQQMDEFISEHKATPGFVDLTRLPDTDLAMKKAAENVDEIWNSIPAELKGKLTKEEFLKTISQEKIKDFIIQDYMRKNPPKVPEKEGEK